MVLGKRQKDGRSLREHLEGVYKMTRVRPPELIQPDVDKRLDYILGWFIELSSGRDGGLSGANPLRWGEIQAWSQMTGRRLDYWEIVTIKAMDVGYLNG